MKMSVNTSMQRESGHSAPHQPTAAVEMCVEASRACATMERLLGSELAKLVEVVKVCFYESETGHDCMPDFEIIVSFQGEPKLQTSFRASEAFGIFLKHQRGESDKTFGERLAVHLVERVRSLMSRHCYSLRTEADLLEQALRQKS